MKKFIIPFLVFAAAVACNSAGKPDGDETNANQEVKKESEEEKGIGKFTKVELGDKLNTEMAAAGRELYDLKCLSCHKLTEERLVGPGWKGVTSRRTPEWVMNFLTNVDEMLDKDAESQAMLEVCLVRMPNQNLTETDARNALEFMRKNDGVQ